MSKYTAEFLSINNTPYKIEITSSTGSKSETVILAESPFVVNCSDEDNLYEPVKTTGATVTLLTKDLPIDIYSGSVLGTSVNLTSNNKVIWTGYLTPCAYSQGFDLPLEELQLECVDGLSVLKDIPFSSNSKEINTFINIIFTCLKKANCFKTLYVANTLQLTSSANDSIMEKIRVSEGNFFNEKDYEAQPDNEVAWMCYDVLFEICQYLSLTIKSFGDEVYILDYDAIRNNKNSYWKYDISGSSIGSKQSVTLSHTYQIKDGSYAETGTQIELSEVFNKLSVKDDFYTLDSATEGMDNSKNWINITDKTDSGITLPSSILTVTNKAGEDENMLFLLTKNWAGRIYFVLCKFYQNPLITPIHYNNSNNTVLSEANFNPMTWTKMLNAKGATPVGYFTRDIEQSTFDSWWRGLQNGWRNFDTKRKLKEYGNLCGKAQIESTKLDNYIVCLNGSTNHISHDNSTKYPFFRIKKNISSLFGGAAGYLCIQGTVIRHDEPSTPFPMQHKDDVNRKNTSVYKNECFVWAQLRWGNKYWQEESHFGTLGGDWTETPVQFRLFYGDREKEIKANDFMDRELEIYNTAAYIWGVDDTGYYVPAPKDGNLAGEVELTIFANKDTKGHWDRKNKKDKKDSYEGYKPYVMMYKNIDIKIGYADEALNEDAASEDTVYTNEVDNYLNINEADEIDCKICTFDDKTPSYSTVDYLDNGTSRYLDTIYNTVYNLALRAEEHIIYRRVNQSREPRIMLNVNLKQNIDLKPYSLLTDKTLSGKSFVIDSMNVDYRFEKAEVKLIEKSNSYQ